MRIQLSLLTGLVLLLLIPIPGVALDSYVADVLRIRSAASVGYAACADPTSATLEPTSLLLFGTTLAGLGLILRRRLRRQSR